jgi:hypothetical protein
MLKNQKMGRRLKPTFMKTSPTEHTQQSNKLLEVQVLEGSHSKVISCKVVKVLEGSHSKVISCNLIRISIYNLLMTMTIQHYKNTHDLYRCKLTNLTLLVTNLIARKQKPKSNLIFWKMMKFWNNE